MTRYLLLLAVVFSPSHLFAQRSTQPQEVYRILGISVEGNTLADASAIIANTGLKIGDDITVPGDQVSNAIKNLWKLKVFADVQILIDRKAGDGVYLQVKVQELPRYEQTMITGNDEISSDNIMKKISLVRGQVIAPNDLNRIQKEITKLYEADGYMLADVRVSSEPSSDTSKARVNLIVRIDEGQEVKVRNIFFSGNTAFEEGDLKGAMKETTEKRWWKIFSSAKFDRKKYEEDKRFIVQFYRKNGYRDASIIGDSIWYSDEKRDMNIRITVYEGKQYKIRTIAWEGNTVYSDTVLNERLGFKRGDVYNQERFEQNLRGNEAQSDVASLYLDNGYLTFNLEPEETRVADDSVDIRVKVYERNKFVIGQVNIKGNTKTYDKVIRRELYTRPGDFFSRAAIIRSIRQLSVLNYFNPEKITPDTHIRDDGKTVDLSYAVEEKSSDNINASVGYSGAFGITGAVGFTLNNFSISEPLSGGAGQILNFEWQFGGSGNYRTFTVGFTEPWLFDTPTLLGVSLYDTRYSYPYDYAQRGGTLRVGRRFRWPDDYFRGDWILTAQTTEGTDFRGFTLKGTQVGLAQIITRNSIDNPVFPTYGSNVSLSIEAAGGPILPGSIDFHKWTFNSEWYVPIFNSSRVALYLNSSFGFVSSFDGANISRIPLIDLFYMGGTGIGYISTSPLRGYEDQAVGPRATSLRINADGGRAMSKQTAELRLALSINPIPIYILGFAEGGNVWETWSKADFFDLKRSAGFGARIQVQPIGLIGFDYGYGFDDVYPLDGKPDGWRFHFVFGRGF